MGRQQRTFRGRPVPEPRKRRSPPTPWSSQAARASWIAPLLALGLTMAFRGSADTPGVAVAILIAVGLFFVVGLLLAIWGLVAAVRFRHGVNFLQSSIGLVINGLLIVCGIAVLRDIHEIAAGAGRYSNEQWSFSIRFPDDWTIEEQGDTESMRVTAKDAGIGGRFGKRVEVLVRRIPAEWGLSELMEEHRGSLPPNEREERPIFRLSGGDRSGEEQGEDGPRGWFRGVRTIDGVEVRLISFYMIQGERGYVLTCMAADDEMDRLWPDLKEIVDSFQAYR